MRLDKQVPRAAKPYLPDNNGAELHQCRKHANAEGSVR